MLRTIIWVIYVVLHTLYTLYHLLIVYIFGALGMREEQEERITKTAHDWGKALITVSGSKVEVSGTELIPQTKAVLFVSNHQSNMDIMLLLGYIPRGKGFVAKVELQKIPLVNTWMRKMHSVFLDRQNMRQSVQVMRQAIDLLKAGHSMVIFPEGTRSKSSHMGEFKRGSLSLAVKANVPIVPITIVDSFKILEGNKGFRIKPTHVKLLVSAPIYPAELPPEQDLTELVRQQILSRFPA
ncbi:MAG: lysophospholipid acyltransferase family protein [Peptococcaceae bacterium]|nr:lysophospholipid acyltransferase family protein [Peptococcaceae bacterium]